MKIPNFIVVKLGGLGDVRRETYPMTFLDRESADAYVASVTKPGEGGQYFVRESVLQFSLQKMQEIIDNN